MDSINLADQVTGRLAGKSLNQHLGQIPLTDLLPYQSFDPETELYYNQGSIGFVLEVAPLVGASEETVQSLNGLLSEILPDEAIAQCTLWASPKIYPFVQPSTQKRGERGGWFEKMAKEREAFLLKGVRQSLISSIPPFRVKNFRCFVSVVMAIGEDKTTETLMACRDKLKNAFSAMKTMALPLRPEAFISLMYDWVNPDLSPFTHFKAWDETRPLGAQMVSPETQLLMTEEGLQLNEVMVTTYSPESFPKEWIQSLNRELLGAEDNDYRQPLGEYFISVTLRKLNSETMKTKAIFKTHQAEKLANSVIAKFLPRAKKIYQDWRYASERLDVGDKVVELAYQVVCYGPHSAIQATESAIKEVYNTKGWQLKREKYISLQTWLAILPMRVDRALFADLGAFHRTRTLLSFNAANLLPLQGEYKGGTSPGMLLLGRRGQLIWFDPFANTVRNYNMAVAGKSGSGKSVFMQELATSVTGAGGRVFIFDIGRSFEKSCKYLGGNFLEFHPDTPICINPFSIIDKFEESLELLIPMFAQMVSSKRDLDDLEESFLQQALRAVWDSHQREGNASLVAQWLAGHNDQRAKDLANMLYPYTEAGRYGRYFNGSCSLDLSNPYIVLELEELKVKKDLQAVVLMVMMYHVTECMYRGDRKQRILCIIDEAWDMMDSKTGGKFIEVGYRRAAKYNGAFVSGTQMLDDYNKSPSSRAARANADILAILTQDASSIEYAADNKLIDDNPHFKKTLKSVKTVENQYAEICIYSSQGYGVTRLLLDPFSSTLYSSKGVVVAAINEQVAKGVSLEEAILSVSEALKRGELK